METLLGIKEGNAHTSFADELNSPLRDGVKDADEAAAATAAEAQEQKGGRHLSRTYFEPVDEGQVGLFSNLCRQSIRLISSPLIATDRTNAYI